MNTVAIRANRRKLLILAFLVLLCAAGYMLVEVNFSNPKLLAYHPGAPESGRRCLRHPGRLAARR